RDQLMLNLGEGKFLDISGVSGMDSITDGRGAVFADFDNDGDLDVFVRALHGTAHLMFRNNVGNANGFLRMALEGRESGRDAFGAVVRVKTSSGILTKVKSAGSGYLSQSDPRLLFGMGEDAKAEWLEVTWPSGRRERLDGPPANSSWLLVEGESKLRLVADARGWLPDPFTEDEARWYSVRVRKGDTFPSLPVTLLDGNPATFASLLEPGRPTLVNLWATWCIPCRKEMPELERIHEAAGEKGLRVIGISIDDATTRDRVPEFLKEMGVSYPIAVAEAEFIRNFYTTDNVAVPISLLLDADGKITELLPGWTPETRRRLEALHTTTSSY
ncbi:MAG: ASPIC/UnbV domain-containing protein, partial [Thermoanaerobaculia bacterium]